MNSNAITKTEFLNAYMWYDALDGHVWDVIFRKRCDEAKVDFKKDRKKWEQILGDMPKAYTIDVNVANQTLTLETEQGTEEFPLSLFCNDSDEPEIEMKWHNNYYDGPISGVALYNSEMVYFDMCDEDDFTQNRKYKMYKLYPDEIDYLVSSHEEFRKMVGSHADHDPAVYNPNLKKDWKQYYKKERKTMELKKDVVLGEFYWHQFKHYNRPRKC